MNNYTLVEIIRIERFNYNLYNVPKIKKLNN